MSRKARLSHPADELDVVAGVIRNTNGRILLAQRRADSHQGGLWEFPGGKRETGETLYQALSRELAEELGITVVSCEPLISVRHSYPEYTVRLNVFDITSWEGQASAMEDQALMWCAEADLNEVDMPEADVPVIAAMRLPKVYPITSPGPIDPVWWQQFQNLLACQYPMLQLRIKGLPDLDMRSVAEKAAQMSRDAGCKLIFNGPPEWVEELGFAGAHLASKQLMSLHKRPLGAPLLVGASCHNLQELRQAERIGADWACLSPVKQTLSHPEQAAMGLEAFRALVAQVNLPVFGLGGLDMADLSDMRKAGGQGIAGISAFSQ